jgi:hypothetical protein
MVRCDVLASLLSVKDADVGREGHQSAGGSCHATLGCMGHSPCTGIRSHASARASASAGATRAAGNPSLPVITSHDARATAHKCHCIALHDRASPPPLPSDHFTPQHVRRRHTTGRLPSPSPRFHNPPLPPVGSLVPRFMLFNPAVRPRRRSIELTGTARQASITGLGTAWLVRRCNPLPSMRNPTHPSTNPPTRISSVMLSHPSLTPPRGGLVSSETRRKGFRSATKTNTPG